MTKFSKNLILFCALFFLCGCYTVPITNRPTLVLAFPGQDEIMGNSVFNSALIYSGHGEKTNNKIKNDHIVNICSNLIEVANKESEIKWNWKIAVVENPEVNACCLPGGKMIIFTGLLNETKNDDEIAAVIGHEMAHALARHKVEEQTLISLSVIGRDVAYTLVNPKYAQWIYLGEVVYPFLFQVFNRYQESEADHIGLMLMAKAGYDPHKAIDFWKRDTDYGYNLMSSKLIDFLTKASHPSATERVADLEDLMDEANKCYLAAPIKRSRNIYTQSSSVASTTSSSNDVSVVINKPAVDSGTKALSNTSETTEQAKTLKSSSELTEPTEIQSSQTDDQF